MCTVLTHKKSNGVHLGRCEEGGEEQKECSGSEEPPPRTHNHTFTLSPHLPSLFFCLSFFFSPTLSHCIFVQLIKLFPSLSFLADDLLHYLFHFCQSLCLTPSLIHTHTLRHPRPPQPYTPLQSRAVVHWQSSERKRWAVMGCQNQVITRFLQKLDVCVCVCLLCVCVREGRLQAV